MNSTKDVFIYTSYIIPALLFRIEVQQIKYIWMIYTATWFLSLPFSHESNFSILSSKGIFESPNSFVFGIFFIFFACQNQKLRSGFSAILLLITLKRIALLGTILSIGIKIVPHRIRAFALNPYTAVVGAILSFMSVISFGYGTFDQFIFNFTGLYPETISLGRYWIYQNIVREIYNNPLVLLFGAGSGSAYVGLNAYNASDFVYNNLHSDVLKIAYEYGLIILSAFIYLMFRNSTETTKLICAYFLICLTTDNIIVFSNIMYFFIFITHSMEKQTTNKESIK